MFEIIQYLVDVQDKNEHFFVSCNFSTKLIICKSNILENLKISIKKTKQF